MPIYYCDNKKCEQYRVPQWSDEIFRPQCGGCGFEGGGLVTANATHGPAPLVPLREQARWETNAEAEDVAASLRNMLETAGDNALRGLFGQFGAGHQFYCQNPVQSGDTTGVGLALALHKQRRILLFASPDELSQVPGFLSFYRGLGVPKSRIFVMVCDPPDERSDNQLREQMRAESRLEGTLSAKNTKSSVRFTTAKELLELRLGATLHGRSRVSSKVRAFRLEAGKLGAFAATVVMWNHRVSRSSNQIYQDIVNLTLRTRNKPGLKRSYEQRFQKGDLQFFEIGQTTRDLSTYLERQGVSAFVKSVHRCFLSRNLGIEGFCNTFVEKLLTRSEVSRTWAKKPIVVLIWIRGLSGRELASVREAKIDPNSVSPENFKRIDDAKRNPHHVMTAQLYEHILLILRRLGNMRTAQRRFIPVPIGDEIRLDQYDPSSGLLVGEQPHNLIRFFSRLEAFGGSRFNQMHFIKSLFDQENFGLAQIGLRSGAMEQGMFMGVPTIYLEEKGAESGERMARLTSDSPKKPNLVVSSYKTMPFFHRLQTQHLIGLNQARTSQGLASFLRAIENPERVVASQRLLEGSVTETEAETLKKMFLAIGEHYESYRAQLGL